MKLLLPPPVVVAVSAAVMWAIDRTIDAPRLPVAIGAVLAIVLAVLAAVLMAVALTTMVKAKTTFDPRKPEKAAHLVTHGVFRCSRNPIYLADLLLLLALACWLGNVATVAVVPGFVLYLNRFQIVPEEAALETRFGDDFRAYRERVRRWL